MNFIAVPSLMCQCLLVSYLNMHLPLLFDVVCMYTSALFTNKVCHNIAVSVITLDSILVPYYVVCECALVFPMLSYMMPIPIVLVVV